MAFITHPANRSLIPPIYMGSYGGVYPYSGKPYSGRMGALAAFPEHPAAHSLPNKVKRNVEK